LQLLYYPFSLSLSLSLCVLWSGLCMSRHGSKSVWTKILRACFISHRLFAQTFFSKFKAQLQFQLILNFILSDLHVKSLEQGLNFNATVLNSTPDN
jgi:hypothetical protein